MLCDFSLMDTIGNIQADLAYLNIRVQTFLPLPSYGLILHFFLLKKQIFGFIFKNKDVRIL